MILLDTDVLIEVLDRNSTRGDQALEAIKKSNENVATSSICMHELLYGVRKYGRRPPDLLRLPVFNFALKDAILSSTLEVQMEERGKAIRRTEAMIAAVTINNSANLFTFDRKHFEGIQSLGLKLFGTA